MAMLNAQSSRLFSGTGHGDDPLPLPAVQPLVSAACHDLSTSREGEADLLKCCAPLHDETDGFFNIFVPVIIGQAITTYLDGWGVSDLLQLKWELIYILKAPVFKFVLHVASSAALATAITMLPSTLELEQLTSDPYFIGCCNPGVRLELMTGFFPQSQKLLTFVYHYGQMSGSLLLACPSCKRSSPLVRRHVTHDAPDGHGGGRGLRSGPKTPSISRSC